MGDITAYGFVGTGELTAAIVHGLSDEVADPPSLFVSPRNRTIAEALAERYPNVLVCDSNQDVLEHATTVVLAVRPQIAGEVLAELAFRPEHVVLSAVAALPLARLRELAAPAGAVVRTIPLPQADNRQSRTVFYPENAVARELFDLVGDVLVPGTEPALEAFSAVTATFAAHLDYLATIADWLAGQGVPPAAAAGYVQHIFAQLSHSLAQPGLSLGELTEKHMTPGGINEQLMTDLRHDGVPDRVRRALDRVLARLRG